MSDPQRNISLFAGSIFVIAIIILLFLYLWPGPFRQIYIRSNQPVRIDRINGNTFVLNDTGWKRVYGNEAAKELPKGQFSDIGATQTSDLYSHELQLSVYNGSGWAITQLTIEMSAGKLHRRYNAKPNAAIKPLSAGNASITFDDKFYDKWVDLDEKTTWTIVSAKGYPTH